MARLRKRLRIAVALAETVAVDTGQRSGSVSPKAVTAIGTLAVWRTEFVIRAQEQWDQPYLAISGRTFRFSAEAIREFDVSETTVDLHWCPTSRAIGIELNGTTARVSRSGTFCCAGFAALIGVVDRDKLKLKLSKDDETGFIVAVFVD